MIGIDCANGATTPVAAGLFESLGCGRSSSATGLTAAISTWIADRCIRNGSRALVVSEGCQMGVAFDGDGDRAIFVDHTGRVVERRCRPPDVQPSVAARRPAAGRCHRGHRHEQHRPGDGAARLRHRHGPVRRRRQVRDGGDAEPRPVAWRRAIRAHHLLGLLVYRRWTVHGVECAENGRRDRRERSRISRPI